jgi:hypothetical protein
MIFPKEIKQKPIEYLCLALGLITLFIFYVFINNIQVKKYLIYTAGIFYFIWSLYHHKKRGDLHLSIIIEYFLIILLGIVFISETL